MTGHVPTVREIQRAVAAHHGLSLKQLLAPTRKRRVIVPRHMAMYLARHMAGKSYQSLAKMFGHRDHTTVINGVRATEWRMVRDREFSERVAKVYRRIILDE